MKKIIPIWALGICAAMIAHSGASLAQANALNTTVTLRSGMAISPALQNAKIIRISAGVGRAQVLQLRDDQIIETPSGRQMKVGSYRRLSAAFASAQTRSAARAAAPFAYSKPAGGITLPAGETPAQLQQRPDNTVVRFANGSVATVGQIKAMRPFIEQRYGVSLNAPPPAAPSGNAVKVGNLDSALAQLKGASDSTILESPQGTRVTVGELKLALGMPALEAAQKARASTVTPITPAPPATRGARP